MLFHKSIVAFVAAITLATSVAAAATPPVTGTGQNTGSPNQGSSQDKNQGSVQGSVQGSTQGPSQAPTCSPGLNPMCCDAVTPFTSLSDIVRTQLKTLDPTMSESCNVGQQCASPVGSQGCGTQLPLCCDAVQSADGIPDLAPSCVDPTNSA
jgi:hypothetical protein